MAATVVNYFLLWERYSLITESSLPTYPLVSLIPLQMPKYLLTSPYFALRNQDLRRRREIWIWYICTREPSWTAVEESGLIEAVIGAHRHCGLR